MPYFQAGECVPLVHGPQIIQAPENWSGFEGEPVTGTCISTDFANHDLSTPDHKVKTTIHNQRTPNKTIGKQIEIYESEV